ncbi:hypothetical protein, partial [Escherichia coli]|uniref:hypothetical protein n=1 Tax=Escherichia coli TaxID=562 RepID=UPI0022835237
MSIICDLCVLFTQVINSALRARAWRWALCFIKQRQTMALDKPIAAATANFSAGSLHAAAATA